MTSQSEESVGMLCIWCYAQEALDRLEDEVQICKVQVMTLALKGDLQRHITVKGPPTCSPTCRGFEHTQQDIRTLESNDLKRQCSTLGKPYNRLLLPRSLRDKKI